MYHHVTSTAPESAAMALKAGCDLNCGVTYLHLLAALQEGRVTEEEIRQAAVHVMSTRIRLGLFADDCEYDKIDTLEVDTDEHAALALEVARRSMVLLRNDGLLPLDLSKLKTVAVVGPVGGQPYGAGRQLQRYFQPLCHLPGRYPQSLRGQGPGALC